MAKDSEDHSQTQSTEQGEEERQADYKAMADPDPDVMDPDNKTGARREKAAGASPDNKPLQEEDDSSWPLAADRVSLSDPLVEALRIIAGHYGRRTSSASLTAGLPVPSGGISPALFVRSAERADLSARLTERSLESLAIAPNLPCILVLDQRQACILWDIQRPKKKRADAKTEKPEDVDPQTRFIVQFPETEDERQTLSLEDLNKIYTGHAFFARPIARSDERAGPAEIDTARNWFWATLWENRSIYGEVVLAAVMINIFALASPLYIMNVYDRVIPIKAMDTLWVLTVGVLTVFIFDFILKNLRAHFLDFAGRKSDVKISAMLFEQIMGMTMSARPASAGVLASNMKEFETLRDFFTSATMAAIIDLPFVFFFILLIGIIGGPIAFVPLLAVPIVLVVGLLLQKPLNKVIKESMNESALKNALLFETITGLETIKMQAAEGHTQRNWEELTDKASRTSVKARRLSAFALNWAVMIQQMASVGVVIVGVFLITEGLLSVGALIACVILTGRAMAPLAQVAGLLTRFSQSKQALLQLDELMKKDVERPAGKHFISKPEFQGRVEFRDVVFHYPGQTTPALKNLSFTIEAGDHVGIIGAVGSGKTTIERLLINLYQPDSGAVLLDGTDVRQIDPGDLRRSVGAVQQSPQLFYGSVRDNITLGHETAPERAVIRASELAGVMEFLRESQAGLDTPVGERGEALSGGQRQAVAVARSLLYDPPVLILDEPTASMDPASENRLRQRLHKLCEGKTTILITHKGAMLTLVNKLILLDRGKIIAYGPKDQVISKLQARQYGSQAENTEA